MAVLAPTCMIGAARLPYVRSDHVTVLYIEISNSHTRADQNLIEARINNFRNANQLVLAT